MICLGFLCWRKVSRTGDGFVAIVGMPAIDLFCSGAALLVFLLLIFGIRALGLPVTAVVGAFSMAPLPFGCFLCVKISREAVCAEMLIWDLSVIIEAQDVLPGVALWAVDCATIIVCIATDALDGIFLLISCVGV